MQKLNLEGMRLEAEKCREETRRLFDAANAIRATNEYLYSDTLKAAAKELWDRALILEGMGEAVGIFNKMEGWFC